MLRAADFSVRAARFIYAILIRGIPQSLDYQELQYRIYFVRKARKLAALVTVNYLNFKISKYLIREIRGRFWDRWCSSPIRVLPMESDR